MKYFLKLISFFLFSFVFSLNISALQYACYDGETDFKIITPDPNDPDTYVDFYKSSGWNAENYICDLTLKGIGYSSCYAPGQEESFCSGIRSYYRSKIENILYVARCPENLKTCGCYTCEVSCYTGTTPGKPDETKIILKGQKCSGALGECWYSEAYEGYVCNCHIPGTSSKENHDTRTISYIPGKDGNGCLDKDSVERYESQAIKDKCTEEAYLNSEKHSAVCNAAVSVQYNKYTCAKKAYIVKGVREAQYQVIIDKDRDNNPDVGTAVVDAYCLNPDFPYPGTHTYVQTNSVKEKINGDDFSVDIELPGDNDSDKKFVSVLASFVNVDSETFNPISCLNTTTRDCGFANILIEGYYRSHYNKDTKILSKDIQHGTKYNYAVIGAALRLWGSHKGLSGYDRTGILDEDDNTIDNPNDWLHFLPADGNKYVNVYEETQKRLLESTLYYLTYENNGEDQNESIHRVDTTAYDFDAIKQFKYNTCKIIENRVNGIMCSNDDGSYSNYLYAFSLFANSFQDNKLMKKHLLEISYLVNDVNITNTPGVDNTPVSGSVTIIDDGIEIRYEFENNVDIKCSTLPSQLQNVEQCKADQKVTVYVEDINGNPIPKEFLIDNYDYCNKNYCYKKIIIGEAYANCDVLKKITSTAVDWLKCQSDSIKSYISCLDSDEHKFQQMISFEPQKCPNPTSTIDLYYSCGTPSCNKGPDLYVPDCTTTGVDNSKGYVYREVSDPSISCILNKDDNSNESDPFASKGFYDYSSLFGVNEEVCKVYCSDKVEYYMASREKVSTSLQLKYNIESNVLNSAGIVIKDNNGNILSPSFPNKNSDKLITDTIVVKRTCVSEIFYDDIKFDNLKKYVNMYGEELFVDADGNIKTDAPDNWLKLYYMLNDIELDEVGANAGAYATLDKYIYDLYNCNFFKGSDIKLITGIDKPEGENNSYQIANDLLQNTKEYCDNNECFSAQIAYQGGAKHAFDSSYAGNDGIVGLDPYLGQDIHAISLENLEVEYCNFGECFENEGNFKDKLENAHSSQSMNVPYGNREKKVPANDYAIFSYSIELDLYNSTNYLTEPHTGNVIDSAGVSTEVSSKYLKLDSYVYPVASSLYNRCKHVNGVFTCDVNHSINIPLITNDDTLEIFDRKSNNDNFIKMVKGELADSNENKANIYSCVYDAEQIENNKIAYRNIDINNPIPNVRESNWSSNAPSQDGTVESIINRIKDSGENNLYADDEYLEYSFILDSNAINSIREYNDKMEGVLLNGETNSEFYRNSCSTFRNINGMELKLRCKSEFLSKLNEASGTLGINVIKGDGKSKYIENKCSISPESFECEVGG